jgi:hypothetical protein
MSFHFLTYNGITKIVSDKILVNDINLVPNNIFIGQWFRYQILKMCENLNIDITDSTTKNIENNTDLARKIENHNVCNNYKFVINDDDMKYGLSPCINHDKIISSINFKESAPPIVNIDGSTLVNPLTWSCIDELNVPGLLDELDETVSERP